MLLKKLILLGFVCGWCCVSVSADIAVRSSVKYNFSKTPLSLSKRGEFAWGNEANALNVQSSIFQEISVPAASSVKMLNQQQNIAGQSYQIISSSSSFTVGSFINGNSSVGQYSFSSGRVSKNTISENKEVSVSVSGSVVSSIPFLEITPKALPSDPDDPGIIPPPDTPIGDGCGILLLFSILYFVAKFRK